MAEWRKLYLCPISTLVFLSVYSMYRFKHDDNRIAFITLFDLKWLENRIRVLSGLRSNIMFKLNVTQKEYFVGYNDMMEWEFYLVGIGTTLKQPSSRSPSLWIEFQKSLVWILRRTTPHRSFKTQTEKRFPLENVKTSCNTSTTLPIPSPLLSASLMSQFRFSCKMNSFLGKLVRLSFVVNLA